MNNPLTYWIGRYKFYILTGLCTILLVGMTLLRSSGQTELEQAYSADSFVNSLGVTVHLRYKDTVYGKYGKIIKPRLQELGIKHIRDGFGVEDVDTQKKVIDLATLGIKSTLVMDPRRQKNASNPVQVAKIVSASVEAVEGPNEWDVQRNLTYEGQAFPVGLINFQSQLYAAIKSDPQTTHLDVLAPSMAHPQNAAKVGKVDCDFGNMHSYPGGGTPTRNLDEQWIPAARLICEDKPIIATESGWHNAISDDTSQPGVSEQASGKYIPRLYLEYFNRGIKRAFIYELIDLSPEVNNNQHNFGLLHYDGSPKPAFNALKNLISLLQDPGDSFSPQLLDYTLSGNTSNVHHTLLQKRDGRFCLILWLEVSSYDFQKKAEIDVPEQLVTLTLNTPVSQANLYQPLQAITPLSQHLSPKQLQLNIPDYPLVIELITAQS